MTATASLFEDQAAKFTFEVRAQLTDLTNDEADELLDGLQADLTDRLTDGDELGDPKLYAAELRQAAGIPPRSETDTTSTRRTFGATLSELGAEWTQRVFTFFDETPARRGFRDFMLSIRGVWWVIRGLVLASIGLFILGVPIYRVLVYSFTNGFILTVGTLVCVVVSVQWGRGRWAPNRWLIALRRALNLVAVVAVLPMMALVGSAYAPQPYTESYEVPFGLNIEGAPITNIFAYDCAGNPIEAVQLYDQDGTPLTTTRQPGVDAPEGWDETAEEFIRYFPNGAVVGDGQWNAFPLDEARWAINEDPYQSSAAESAKRAEPAAWPFTERGPLNTECATVGAASDAPDGASAPNAPSAEAPDAGNASSNATSSTEPITPKE